MARIIDIEANRGLIWVSFPYDAECVAVVRTLPDRKFDSASKRWSVPISHVAALVDALEDLHFKFSPRMREFWNDADITGPVVSDGLTVSQLNREARRVVATAFSDEFWLVAEIQGFDKSRGNGHAYFELVERDQTRLVARVDAVFFDAARRRVEARLAQAESTLSFRDGLTVRVRCRADLYEKGGRFQVQIVDVDDAYTSGQLLKKRDQVLAEIRRMGIAGQNLAIPTPICPLRVGLVTSYQSDAYNDFIHEIERADYPITIRFHHARMQGPESEASVLNALRHMERNRDDLDIVAIVRGGGSRSDLSYMDSLSIGRAICLMSNKVVCGVGHHRDQSVIDFLSVSEKTPTAAARWVVHQIEAFEDRLAQHTANVISRTTDRLDRASTRVEEKAVTVAHMATQILQRQGRGLDRRSQSLVHFASHRNHVARRALQRLEGRIASAATLSCEREDRRVRGSELRMTHHRFQNGLVRRSIELQKVITRISRETQRALKNKERRLDSVEREVFLLDPNRILERGFSILRRDGKVVPFDHLKPTDTVDIEFFAGVARATIDQLNTRTEDADDD